MIGRSVQNLQRYLLDRMVLRPSRSPIDHGEQIRKLVPFGDRHLECFVHHSHGENRSPELLVLKFPGTAGRAERASDFPIGFLPDLPATVWTWNPPGYGGSSGKASLRSIADAALDFWNHVAAEASAETPVVFCGNSLGCVTALWLASNVCEGRERCGLVLRNPPPLIPVVKRVARRYPMGVLAHPIADSLCERMNATVTASRVTAPAVFLQSELDTLVPPALQQQVVDAYGGETKQVLLAGLSHGGIADESHEHSVREAFDWLWSRMMPS